MQRKFNVTGICIPSKHYMVNISGKIAEIMKLVDEGLYFTINRPRQYGKITTLFNLENILKEVETSEEKRLDYEGFL